MIDYSEYDIKMFDKSRLRVAKQILSLLRHFYRFSPNRLQHAKVLNAGCSTGIIVNVVSTQVDSVVGIDIDAHALDYAKKHFKKKNISFFHYDLSHVPYPKDSFDIIILSQVLQCVTSPSQVVEEIYRVLRPKGICVFLGKNFYTTRLDKKNRQRNFSLHALSYFFYKSIFRQFFIHDYLPLVLRYPKKFAFTKLYGWEFVFCMIPLRIIRLLEFLSPNIIWILEKKKG